MHFPVKEASYPTLPYYLLQSYCSISNQYSQQIVHTLLYIFYKLSTITNNRYFYNYNCSLNDIKSQSLKQIYWDILGASLEVRQPISLIFASYLPIPAGCTIYKSGIYLINVVHCYYWSWNLLLKFLILIYTICHIYTNV